MKRIGLYPGTFDPIHIGHITFALGSLKQLQLDEVVFLPEDQPRRKQGVTPRHERMQQVNTALSKYDDLSALQLDDTRFTIQKTLPKLQKLFPDTRLTLLIGSDVVNGLERWEGVEKMLASMSLAIGMRTGSHQEDVANIIQKLEKRYSPRIDYRCIDTSHAHVASTQLRRTKLNKNDQ